MFHVLSFDDIKLKQQGTIQIRTDGLTIRIIYYRILSSKQQPISFKSSRKRIVWLRSRMNIDDAAESGDLNRVQQLVERGADKDKRNRFGWTPLFAAAFSGHLNVVQYLAEQGADKEARDNDGWTPLYLAVFNGHMNVVQYLLEQGENKVARDDGGWTPLHAAACRNNYNIVKYLIQQGADLTARTDENTTPFQFAERRNNVEIAEYLAQQERYQLLVVHDSRELLTRLGLFSVERDMILSFCFRRENESNDQLDIQTVRTEYNALHNAANDNADIVNNGDNDMDRESESGSESASSSNSSSIATRTRSAKRQKRG